MTRSYLLEYEESSGRFVIGEHELHCGEGFRMKVWPVFGIRDFDKWVDCRVEMTDVWVVSWSGSPHWHPLVKFLGCEVSL